MPRVTTDAIQASLRAYNPAMPLENTFTSLVIVPVQDEKEIDMTSVSAEVDEHTLVLLAHPAPEAGNPPIADIYSKKGGKLTRCGNMDMDAIDFLYRDNDPDIQPLGTTRMTIDSNTNDVYDEPVGGKIIEWTAQKINRGVGGIFSYVVDSLMEAAIEGDSLKANKKQVFCHTGIDRVRILRGANQTSSDPVDMVEISQLINDIKKNQIGGIYLISSPTGTGHQVSLVFDNRSENKILYTTNSITSGEYLPSGLDSDITVTSGRKILVDKFHQPMVATQSHADISCGVCTYVNSLNLAAKLIHPDTDFQIKKTHELEVRFAIMDNMDKSSWKYIDEPSLQKVIDKYIEYENLDKNDKDLLESAKQNINFLLDNMTHKTESNKVEFDESKIDLYDVQPVDKRIFIRENSNSSLHMSGLGLFAGSGNPKIENISTEENLNTTKTPGQLKGHN